MEKLIDDVLEKYRDTNLHSAAGRQVIVKEMMKKLRSDKMGWVLNMNRIDGRIPDVGDREEEVKWVCKHCSESTFEVNYDSIGSEYNHLSCDLKEEEKMGSGIKQFKGDLQKRIYNELTIDGLPAGGDSQAVIESHKLAEEIIDNKDERYIYESPDGGKTVFRRGIGESKRELVSEEDWEQFKK